MYTESDSNESPRRYTHRVYGKLKTEKRFKPMDLRNGRFVGNLIYASMLSENDAKVQVAFMNESNPDYEFVARKM